MIGLILDLYKHQAWADAELWKAFEAFPLSLEDAIIKKRQHHIHFVQQSFLFALKREPITFKKLRDFSNMGELKLFAINYHNKISEFLAGCTEQLFNEILTIPWFKNPPLSISTYKALMQTVMHSHYHRGQNSARLRELGGDPPLTDFIAWYWQNCPEPDWNNN